MSLHAFIDDSRSRIDVGTLSTTETAKATTRGIRDVPATRESASGVRLTGDFVGPADTTIEVEIVAPAVGAAPLVGDPLYRGVGNPEMTAAAAVAGTATQTVRFTLDKAAELTRNAEAAFFGVNLESLQAGIAGQGTEITVVPMLTRSTLTPPRTTIAELATGQQRFEDELAGVDGIYPLQPDGTLNAETKRFAFEGFNDVYRLYVANENNKRVVYLDKQIPETIPAFTALQEVTGGYDVTITNPNAGSPAPEMYTVETLYEFLSTIRVESALIGIKDGVVVDDRTPGGMAVDEFPARTESFARSLLFTPTGGEEERRAPAELEITSLAAVPSGEITLECTQNFPVGAEKWAATTTLDKDFESEVITGQVSTVTDVQFKIPADAPDGPIVEGTMNLKKLTVTDTSAAVCLRGAVLGAAAETKTYTLRYTVPVSVCDCSDVEFTGGPLLECLGVDAIDSTLLGGSTLITDPDHLSRVADMASIYKARVSANTKSLTDYADDTPADTALDQYDLDIILSVVTRFSASLQSIFNNATSGSAAFTSALAIWDAAWLTAKAELLGLDGIQDLRLGNADVTLVEGSVVSLSESSGSVFVSSFNATGLPRVYAYQPGVRRISLDATGETLFSGAWLVTGQFPTTGTDFSYASTAGVPGVDPTTVYLTDLGPLAALRAETFNLAVAGYETRVNACLWEVSAALGIDPFNEASNAGGVCWQDQGDTAPRWEFEGEDLLPAWPGIYYNSAVLGIDGEVKPAELFGFAITSCGGFSDGDTLQLVINVDGVNFPFSVGDKYVMGIEGAAEIVFSGAINGSNLQRWAVRGSELGPLPAYDVNISAPVAYSAAGGAGQAIDALITEGPIPSEEGSYFEIAIVAARYTWKQDAGAATAPIDLANGPLVDGLDIAFEASSASPFAIGDIYTFEVEQRHALDHVTTTDGEVYAWPNSNGQISNTPTGDVDTVVLWATLPDTATLVCTVGGTPVTLVANALGVYVGTSATPLTGDIAISIDNATGGSVRYLCAGQRLEIDKAARELTRVVGHAMDRVDRSFTGRWLRERLIFEMDFTYALTIQEYDELEAMRRRSKMNCDAPVFVLANLDDLRQTFAARWQDVISTEHWLLWHDTAATGAIAGSRYRFEEAPL